jgi:enoyl-CoA hydratase/carnithine racemase
VVHLGFGVTGQWREAARVGEFVSVETGGDAPAGVATIRLARPPMNALNTAMQEELRAAAQQLAAADAVRAVVIWGGEKVFAAGADVKEFAGQSHARMMRDATRLTTALDALARLPKPVIAAVTGYALGGGCELALTADFRVSADTAKWGQPEILLGIIPGAGGTQRLPRLVGPSKAKDLIYTGRFVDADEALQIGLVDVVVPAADVYPTALAMAAKFANGPTLALAAAKAAIDGGLDGDLATGLRLEAHLFASLFATDDRRIGMQSFLEKGPGKAVFTGAGTGTAAPAVAAPGQAADGS